eukprot:CAMPEP_0197516928 /NCGR_PEP_ID=MMETSP1318-20131121/1883_1 /TAXON_ID=552666 /ORGANISM="Partenskyella glossopodia, Strain RCC365" /LENGTH=187 /DNA_ID=CAMNT_0043066081 /DNA_START=69 /DNA_END=632 /DNA_ORIENTATION=-
MNADEDEPCLRLFRNGKLTKADWRPQDGIPPRRLDVTNAKLGSMADAHEILHDIKQGQHFTYQAGSASTPPFQTKRLCIDYIFYTPTKTNPDPSPNPNPNPNWGLKLRAIRLPFSGVQRRILNTRQGIPNRWHPSDHFPVSAIFEVCRKEDRGSAARRKLSFSMSNTRLTATPPAPKSSAPNGGKIT